MDEFTGSSGDSEKNGLSDKRGGPESHETPSGASKDEGVPKDVPVATQELISSIEMAFNSFTTTDVEVDGTVFRLVGLDEMPIERLIRMSHARGKRQVMIMRDYAKICLINPQQWDILETLNFNQFAKFVEGWIINSKGIPLIDNSEDGDEDFE